ncbi:MAG: ABC transporter permease [Austwickia sp.]|nr:ABC transporter permease [Austwickia sp.]MBK8436201.1 ABC transporter permease [Austwickia sp.]MBK9101882.1 ABC transporter permease [Austwickia sp.]
MNTVATLSSSSSRPELTAPAVSGIPMTTVIRVETRKLIDTLSGRWLLIAIGALTAVVLVAMWFTVEGTNATFENYLSGTASPLMMLLPVLGILAATSEWSQRTGLTTYTLEPRRLRVLVAKLVGSLMLGLACIVLAFALAAAITAAGISAKNPAHPWSLSLAIAGGFVLALMLSLAQGVAVGTLIPNTPAAVVVYFLVPFAWMFLMQWERMRTLRPWADLNSALRPLFEGGMTGQDWAHLAVATSIWVVLPLVAGALVLRRREVK